LNKKTKIVLIILLLVYPIYKGLREVIWVDHSTYTLNNSLKVDVRLDVDMFGFQDYDNIKTITITNLNTKAKTKASYVSLEPNLYFYIDTVHSTKVLSVVDRFAGQNSYDYMTLQLIGSQDCFKEYGGCGGFDDDGFANLGTPFLNYENNNFHK
jgi:hypothetical protein